MTTDRNKDIFEKKLAEALEPKEKATTTEGHLPPSAAQVHAWITGYRAMAAFIEDWGTRKGWNEDDPVGVVLERDSRPGVEITKDHPWAVHYDIAKIGLMGTELSEAIEGRRHGDPASDKIPDFTAQEEELADTIVRIMHYSAHRNLRVAEALVAKLDYNETRAHKHGKQA